MTMVQMFVYRLGIDVMGHALVILADEELEKLLPIWIGPYEAHAIAAAIEGKDFERPLTHDLLTTVIHSLDCHLARITVTKIEEKTYYALLTLEQDGRRVEVDSRPSDAIALALRTGAEIFVAEDVLAQSGIPWHEAIDEAEEIDTFKELIRRTGIKLDPDSFHFQSPSKPDEDENGNDDEEMENS